jgi:hypothetical protein
MSLGTSLKIALYVSKHVASDKKTVKVKVKQSHYRP